MLRTCVPGGDSAVAAWRRIQIAVRMRLTRGGVVGSSRADDPVHIRAAMTRETARCLAICGREERQTRGEAPGNDSQRETAPAPLLGPPIPAVGALAGKDDGTEETRGQRCCETLEISHDGRSILPACQ
jgi:hypothetical protein